MRILILEDNAEHRTAMIEHLADRVPMFGTEFFETAPMMCEAIERDGLDDVVLISLDNDLEPVEFADGKPVDPGSGVDVAECLVGHFDRRRDANAEAIPMIVHSTNEPAALKIMQLMQDAGVRISRIVPYDAEAWIGEIWIREVRRLIVDNVTQRRDTTLVPQDEMTP